MRGSAEGSVDTTSSRRPSSGAALCSFGNETENRGEAAAIAANIIAQIAIFSICMFVGGTLAGFRRNQAPSFEYAGRQFLVADAIEFDADPTAHADIRRFVVLFGGSVDQHFLEARRGGNPHRDVSVVMVVIREHDVDPLTRKECRLTVRKLLRGIGKSRANLPHAMKMLFG